MWFGANMKYGQTLHRSFNLSPAIWVLLNTSVPSPAEDAPVLPHDLNYVERGFHLSTSLVHRDGSREPWFAGIGIHSAPGYLTLNFDLGICQVQYSARAFPVCSLLFCS